MIIQEIPWKIGNDFIRVVIDDTDDWKVKVLSITSTTANTGFGRSQEITIKMPKGSLIKTKNFLVYQPGLLSHDGGIASTSNKDYTNTIDCSTSDSEFGTSDNDNLYDCGYAFLPNLLKETKDGFISPWEGNVDQAQWGRFKKIFFDSEVKLICGDKLAVKIDSITQLKGNATEWSILVYGLKNGQNSTQLSVGKTITAPKFETVIEIIKDCPDDEIPTMFFYPGVNGQLAGCQAQYGRVMCVKGETFMLWAPAASEIDDITF